MSPLALSVGAVAFVAFCAHRRLFVWTVAHALALVLTPLMWLPYRA